MADRFTLTQGVQIGKESTHGTAVPATMRLKAATLAPRPMGAFKEYRPQGLKRKAVSALAKEWTEANLSGLANYTELGILLESLVGNRATTAEAGGVYEHAWISNRQEPDAMATLTCEIGSADGCERFAYGLVSALGFKMTRDDVEISGHLYGGKLQTSTLDSISLTQGPNEVQTITLTGSPSAGSFTLSFNEATTAPIDHAASGSTMQSALEALSTVGSGNVQVTGASGGPYTATFVGALGHRAVALLEADGSGLTGGGVSVALTTQGGLTEHANAPLLPGDVNLYLADSPSALGGGGTQMLRAFDASWSFGERAKPFWTQDASLGAFSGYAETEPKEMLDLLLAADAQGVALLSTARSGATKYLRIAAASKALTIGSSGTPYRFQLDAAVKVSAFKEFKDEQGVYCVGYELEVVDDAAWGKSYVFSLRNGVAAY
ncbi:MAG: hypothetical protein HYR64_03745 [Fimbriimonas ginsengisoli]|uniref:Phage tail protein n=1 Tax=Fimbriimonas ginsengisoli TaxID=1005039 RepID=A0A931LV02_FIMGI|nr:hypothetical protein [Fimbriimonas ginsengisoli]